MLYCTECDAEQFVQYRCGLARVIENGNSPGAPLRKLGFERISVVEPDGIFCKNSHLVRVPPAVLKRLGLDDLPAQRSKEVNVKPLLKKVKKAVPDATAFETWLQDRKTPPRFGDSKNIEKKLNSSLMRRFQAGIGVDIHKLYSHQTEAIEAALCGNNVVLQTPTASGKSICYLMPVFNELIKNKSSSAIFVFPTKALSFDQIGKILRIGEDFSIGGMSGNQSVFPIDIAGQKIHCARWDRDIAYEDQRRIKRDARILITNPDAIHAKLLPHLKTKTGSWENFLRNLRFVVLDEIHEYRGVFGANVALLVRRLRMLCETLGNSRLQFICCSATLPNPKEHAEELVGAPFEAVTECGAPGYPKIFSLWNPGMKGKSKTERREPSTDAIEILPKILDPKSPVQTITFIQSLGGVERFNRVLSRALTRLKSPLADKTATYTSRLHHKQRVEIQTKVASGEVVHVTATRALELGIDMGDLNCCIMLGYPGSVASTLQEAGRVGRTGESLVVLMLRADPYEQYFARMPDAFFELLKTSETPKLPIENEYLLSRHVMCANWEAVNFKGYTESNFVKFFPARVKQVLDQLESEDKIASLRDKGQMFWRYKKGGPPFNDVYQSIRVPISIGKFNVIERGSSRSIGECDSYLVPRDLFPGAVWLNNGEAFRSVEIKYGEKVVYVDRLTDDDPDVETFALPQYHITPNASPKIVEFAGCAVGACEVNVIRQVKLYREVAFARGSEDKGEIKTTWTNDIEYDTMACWFDFDPEVLLSKAKWRSRKIDHDNAIAGVHGFEHLIRSVAPHVAGCDRHDISSSIEFTDFSKRQTHRVYLLDTFAGGIGFAEFCFAHADKILEWSYRSLNQCKCKHGCPQCLIVPWCSLRDVPVSKKENSYNC